MTELEAKAAEIQTANSKLIAEMQAENERRLKGFVSDAAFADLQATWQKKWDAQEVEIAKLKKPETKSLEIDPTVETKAFSAYLRKGVSALGPEERKVLTIADSTHAGVLAPAEYVNEIIHYASVMHPMRQIATVQQTDRYAVQFPTETAIGVATWVAESGTKSETTGLTYALTTVTPQEMKILYKATQKMLEDSQFNLEAEIAQAVGRAMGTLEGTAFYSGDGSTTGPEGITINSTVLADHRDVATDNTLAFDDFIGVQYQLESPYARNASWVFNRSLMGVVVSLKSATTNTYLLQPNLQAGQPPTILGSPVYEWSDFPAISSTTLSSTPGDGGVVLAYGDFRWGYRVVDRVGISIQRLNELYAADGMIGFYARFRVGGGVVVPAAIQLLKNITS